MRIFVDLRGKERPHRSNPEHEALDFRRFRRFGCEEIGELGKQKKSAADVGQGFQSILNHEMSGFQSREYFFCKDGFFLKLNQAR